MARTKTRRSQGFSVYQRKDDRWGWAVTTGYHPVTGNPQRVQGICKTQKEASEAAVLATAKVKTGAHIPQGKDQTVGAYLDEWLETYIRPNREPKTTTYYAGMIKQHLKPAFDRTPLRKLTVPMVQRLLNEKAKPQPVKDKPDKTLSANTIRGIRATLRSALTQAVRNGLVVDNVAQKVTTPKVKSKKQEFLEPGQVKKLLIAAEGHHLHSLITIAVHTGMRIGEITGLTWSCVDLEKKALRIEHQLQRINGKLQLKSLKSDRSRRTLHLTKTAIEALRNEKSRQLLELSPGQNPLDLVFLNHEQRPLDPKFVNDNLKALMVKAEIPPMSFHKLRHTAATQALASGIPITHVQDQLGHSQISLTKNIYGHAVPTALQDVAEALDRMYKE